MFDTATFDLSEDNINYNKYNKLLRKLCDGFSLYHRVDNSYILINVDKLIQPFDEKIPFLLGFDIFVHDYIAPLLGNNVVEVIDVEAEEKSKLPTLRYPRFIDDQMGLDFKLNAYVNNTRNLSEEELEHSYAYKLTITDKGRYIDDMIKNKNKKGKE